MGEWNTCPKGDDKHLLAEVISDLSISLSSAAKQGDVNSSPRGERYENRGPRIHGGYALLPSLSAACAQLILAESHSLAQ